MTFLSDHNIKSLTKKLSSLFNVRLKKSAVLSTGASQLILNDRKAFLDDQFRIIMQKIRESHA